MADPDSTANARTNPVYEVALLTKSIEFVVRRLVKMLIGKITLVRLQDMIETSFVEESERYLRKERPGRDVPLTSLALITGVDTRKLAKIRNSEAYRKPKHETGDFVSSLTAEGCIVDLWTSDSRFTDLQTGQPKSLEIWGEGDTFEALVKESIRSRGVTVTSALDRMKKGDLVTIQDDEWVQLKSKDLAPKTVREQIGNLKLGLDAAGHLLETVDRNLSSPDTGNQRFFQRGSWTHRLSPRNREVVEAKMRSFLEDADNEARRLLEPYEEPEAVDSHLTAGVGFYYFETETF